MSINALLECGNYLSASTIAGHPRWGNRYNGNRSALWPVDHSGEERMRHFHIAQVWSSTYALALCLIIGISALHRARGAEPSGELARRLKDVKFEKFAVAPGYSEGPTWLRGEVYFCSGPLWRVDERQLCSGKRAGSRLQYQTACLCFGSALPREE
jgi:hypothetical protein